MQVVLGPRQAGKSTLLAHHLAQARGVLVVNLQDRRVRQRYERDEGLLVREVEAAAQVKAIMIDEIQKVPALLEDIQYLHDTYRDRYSLDRCLAWNSEFTRTVPAVAIEKRICYTTASQNTKEN